VSITLTLLLTSLVLVAPLAEAQTYVQGEIAGIQSWVAPGPYIATADVFVTGELAIESNIDVLFNDDTTLYVAGRLVAGMDVLFNENGSSVNPWRGIHFNSTSSDSAIVSSNISASSVGVFINGTSTPPILTGTTIYGTGV
jgi:hypothetical protein